MYLTRIKLDTSRRSTMKALSNPNILHGAIEQAFEGERQHPLWRIDTLRGEQYLLILSEQIPDMDNAVKQFGSESAPAETRDYTPLLSRIQMGTRWHFRLTANPTYSKSKENGEGKRGAVHAHKVPKHQKEWLKEKQSVKHGFQMEYDDFEVVQTKWLRFLKGNTKGNTAKPITLLSVTFEGFLTITDEELFTQMLCNGIGRGKAYGMGLMTVVRCNEA